MPLAHHGEYVIAQAARVGNPAGADRLLVLERRDHERMSARPPAVEDRAARCGAVGDALHRQPRIADVLELAQAASSRAFSRAAPRRRVATGRSGTWGAETATKKF